MIKYAIENGFDKYNFYGIPADINTKPENYGLYEFKKGFTTDESGRVVELLGTYEKRLSAIYPLIKVLGKFVH